MKTHARVAILGAGLSGLSIGYFLNKKGISADIFEKGSRIGGVIQSNKEAGFLYEHGPNTGVLSNTIIEQLFADISEHCTIEVANEAAKKRLILKNGKWHALPSGLFSGIGTPLFTTMDKFRILGEPFRKAGTNPDESLRAFVERRLGKSFHDYAVAPFINGIYAGNT
ncbi:MAG: protoporphyrinogen oxidase [Bacteroidales bacterium]|nr:protoporphyrinogen oxidase [Bacteroidales bacterium]